MELMLFAGLMASLFWGLGFLRRVGIWGMMLATLVIGTLFGYAFFHLSVISSDRVLIGLTLVVFFIARHLGQLDPARWTAGDTVMLWFLGAMVFTTFRGDWRADGGAPVSRLLFLYLLPATLYWVARRTPTNPQQLRGMFAVFAALGFYLAITAIAEKLEIRGLIFPRYIADPEHMEFLGRARGPLLNPSANGVILILGLAASMLLVPHVGRVGRLLTASSVVLHLVGIVCTLTRCVWMGGAVTFAMITYAGLPKRFRFSFLLMVVGCGGLFLAAKSQSFSSFKRDKNVSVADMRESARLRPILATIAWQMFLDRPWFGCGTARYTETAKDYFAERSVDLPLEKARDYVQHNIFLGLLTENGLLGLLPYAILLGLWTLWAYRLWSHASLPLEVRQTGLMFLGFMNGYMFIGMFQDVLIMTMMSCYLFFLAGSIRNLYGRYWQSRESTSVLTRRESDHNHNVVFNVYPVGVDRRSV